MQNYVRSYAWRALDLSGCEDTEQGDGRGKAPSYWRIAQRPAGPLVFGQWESLVPWPVALPRHHQTVEKLPRIHARERSVLLEDEEGVGVVWTTRKPTKQLMPSSPVSSLPRFHFFPLITLLWQPSIRGGFGGDFRPIKVRAWVPFYYTLFRLSFLDQWAEYLRFVRLFDFYFSFFRAGVA
ncbi:hypothetical protein B296_00013393 [Ensete ventricosum]|uniref:Uncharacterized protein n=1 Tax=Ensete ventricosum TaxID=4639 RepID=A0A427ATH6_ENSVE|nr:hypothetical protein B296_00013393 [Ensete ventricosum]